MALYPTVLNVTASKYLLSNTVKLCHTSAGKLRIPANLAEEAETQKVKFSPQRHRDTSGAHIAARLNKVGAGPVFGRGFDSSACRNFGSSFNAGSSPKDNRAPVYDQMNACSLSSVMQTNVPQPVKSDGRGERSGHLSMPGGQWSQNDKYISSDLHEHHYQNNLSNKAKSEKKRSPPSTDALSGRGGRSQFECRFARLQSVSASNLAVSAAYSNTILDPASYPLMFGERTVHSSLHRIHSVPHIRVPVDREGRSPSSHVANRSWCLPMPRKPLMLSLLSSSSPSVVQYHELSSSSFAHKENSGANLDANGQENSEQVLTSGQKIKRAVKEYGTAVIVFHVTISLASLGLFYLLVSSGIDMGGLIQRLGIDLSEAVDSTDASAHLPASDAENLLNNTSSDDDNVKVSKLSTTGNVAAGVSTFVVAYAIHKVFAPLRVGITLSVVPFVVRYYRRAWKKR